MALPSSLWITSNVGSSWRAEEANIGACVAPARLVDRSHASGSTHGNAGIMDQSTMELLARRAGLNKALAEFP
jgi:hypothetical protein